MRLLKITALSVAALATLGSSAAMASVFHPGKHRVCHIERHHHHSERVCSWRR